MVKLAFEVIPQHPARSQYCQCGPLGHDHQHWFRAKFFQQDGLCFRYHAASKLILDLWLYLLQVAPELVECPHLA
ncbi:MAG TPA: hypothetical protein DDY43_14050 [Synechococcales bacterium UBA10510]|nr:hypothetical protein [Synechococcales bacterium UBA10510]